MQQLQACHELLDVIEFHRFLPLRMRALIL